MARIQIHQPHEVYALVAQCLENNDIELLDQVSEVCEQWLEDDEVKQARREMFAAIYNQIDS